MMGAMTVFLRLAGCNAFCSFCDTKNSWDEYIETSPQQVEDAIRRAGPKRVVVTGGEPTLQMEELAPIVYNLRSDGYHVALETNGIISDYSVDMFDLVVVSPKRLEDWDKWINKNVTMKFVVDKSNVDAVMTWVQSKGLSNVYFMPEGIDLERILVNTTLIIAKMAEYQIDGFVSPRIHYLIGVK